MEGWMGGWMDGWTYEEMNEFWDLDLELYM
jgi:hypothetical protein